MSSRPLTKELGKRVDGWVGEVLHGYKPRHIRDSKVVRDAVHGFSLFYPHEVNIIDSPLLQRLRFIRQTSLACCTYPSASHSRFEHSLGCVSVADRIIRAINNKRPPSALPLQGIHIAEIRLAALLHDCGHGPFSHASEFVYDELASELQDIRFEDRKRFLDAAGHEILSYLIVTSENFLKLWKKICNEYKPSEHVLCDPWQVDPKRIGLMILGLRAEPYPEYVSKIINGPFDADKFDYIIRDGYFSGLTTSIDIDRLAVSLDLDTQDGEEKLCMDIGGATILEQLLFNKMVLFSSMYHHHKVRAGFRQLARLFATARDQGIRLGGADLQSAAGFLALDDPRALVLAMQDARLNRLAKTVCERELPMRALVIDNASLSDSGSRNKWVQMADDRREVAKLEKEIASKAKMKGEDVCIDFPPPPRIHKTAQFSLIRPAPGRPLVSLDSLYPVAGWLAGYEEHRFKSYLLCPSGFQEKVKTAAEQVFAGRGIRLDLDLAVKQAKWG